MLKRIFYNENVINGAVILNCLVIFLLLFNELPVSTRIYLVIIDWLFNFFFITECFVKIYNDGTTYFRKYNNIFDFILVMFLVIAIVFNNYYIVSNFYVIRIIRIWKCSKLFNLIPNYQRLITNIKLAFKTSFELFIGVLSIIFIISLLLTTIYGETSVEYFGNPFKSMYSIFRILTLEGWYEIPNILSNDENIVISFLTKTLFSLIVLIGGIFGVSFITSIVTDELSTDNNNDVLTELKEIKEQIKNLKK